MALSLFGFHHLKTILVLHWTCVKLFAVSQYKKAVIMKKVASARGTCSMSFLGPGAAVMYMIRGCTRLHERM